MARFQRLELRTKDVAASRAFYAPIIGQAEGISIVPLPAPAAARGAPSHWLGYLGVDDVAHASVAIVERGGAPLGPLTTRPDGTSVAVVRDPGGAVVGLESVSNVSPPSLVVSQTLQTESLAQAVATYRDLFDWHDSIVDVAHLPEVHAHWLFQLRVPDLEQAMQYFRDARGLVLPPLSLPNGDRMVVCDDPQGAAIALRQVAGLEPV